LKNFNAYRKAAENAEFNDSAEEYHHSKPALPDVRNWPDGELRQGPL
jgi:hypothetical protein